MKVLLINPWESDIFPPPSLGYLQAILKYHGVEVRACDLYEAFLEKDEYDLVGVSFHSFSVKYAELIRNRFKGRLICGGHHPSALPQQMLDLGYDQVVVGEGELAILDILQGNTNRIVYGRNCDLNDVPFPDYKGFRGEWTMGVPVISSRGCPFDCSFCASADFWKRKWRMRSMENVIEEIVSQQYKTFMFEDDNFTLDRERVLDICRELKKDGEVHWQCASRAETLVDEELCRNLYEAGCHTVWLGIESLSQDSLDRCSKRTTVERMLRGITVAHSQGLKTMAQFISGIPGDTKNNIDETVYNIRRAKIKKKGTSIMWVLPNTDVYHRAKERGFDDSVYLKGDSLYYTYEQDFKTLRLWATLINRAS